MNNLKAQLKHLGTLFNKLLLETLAITMATSIVLCLVTAIYTDQASAAQLQSRSVTVSSSALGNVTTDQLGNAVAAGSGGNGQKTEETFNFTTATTSNVGSILFEICTTPIAGTTCTSPTGFTAANVSAITGTPTNLSGFSVDTSTVLTGSPYNCTGSSPGRTNCIAITKGSPSNINSGTAITIAFGGGSSNYITNPTTAGTFFVRIVTYSDSAYSTQVDYGTVASSTATEVNINANVQETLGFSVGTTVTSPNGTTCSPFTDTGALSLGDSNSNLSSTLTYYNHSYYRIYTNDLHGSEVLYSGNTLHNAGNTASITAAGTSASSSTGTSQFGIAIDQYDTESGSGYSFTSPDAAVSPYNGGPTSGLGAQSGSTASLSGTYSFSTASVTSPVEIAASTAPISCDTGSVIYMANIATTTPTSAYGTTINYIAVPTY